MSSHAISGKPGGGKSYYSVSLIIKELLSTKRPIVTNIPLNLIAMQNYFEHVLESPIDVYERITILTPDQFGDFWRFRGNGFLAENITPKQFADGMRPDWDLYPQGGVAYFLDEVHEYLNSRQWASTGPLLLYYIAKHRHLGDDVFWITQSVMNVDKQWRSTTQDYSYCRNWSKEKFKGFVKGKGFACYVYLEPFTGSQIEQEYFKFNLDPEIAKCYSTSIAGQSADVNQKLKGFNIKFLYLGFAIVLFLCLLALFIFPKYLFGLFYKKPIIPPAVSAPAILPPPISNQPSFYGAGISPSQAPVYTSISKIPDHHNSKLISQLAVGLGDLAVADPRSSSVYILGKDSTNAAKISMATLPSSVYDEDTEYRFFNGVCTWGGKTEVSINNDSWCHFHDAYHFGDHTPNGVVISISPEKIVFSQNGVLHTWLNSDAERVDPTPNSVGFYGYSNSVAIQPYKAPRQHR